MLSEDSRIEEKRMASEQVTAGGAGSAGAGVGARALPTRTSARFEQACNQLL